MNEKLAAVACAAAPVFVLMALCRCVRAAYRREPMPQSVWPLSVCLLSAALLAGGKWLLERFGLAWRNGPAMTLFLAALGALLILVLLTMGWVVAREMADLAPVLQWTVKGAALICAGLVFFYTLTFGLIFAVMGFGDGERVMDYQGQRLVEVERGWLDTSYVYYQYHGPLVRGDEIIHSQLYTPLDGNG